MVATRVLIIEDNHDAADSMQMLLGLHGHDVRVAYDGPDGVRLAATWSPDVVVSDIGLPGLDGFEVARELRSNPTTAGARLIAVTGYDDAPTWRRALDSGFDHFFGKPTDTAALLKLLPASPPA